MMPKPPDKPPLTIRYGNQAGRYFTQWRFDDLTKLAQEIYRETDIDSFYIWYDDISDFHRLSFRGHGRDFEVRLYKTYTLMANGVVCWAACPGSRFFDFVEYIGRELQKPLKVHSAELKPE